MKKMIKYSKNGVKKLCTMLFSPLDFSYNSPKRVFSSLIIYIYDISYKNCGKKIGSVKIENIWFLKKDTFYNYTITNFHFIPKKIRTFFLTTPIKFLAKFGICRGILYNHLLICWWKPFLFKNTCEKNKN